MVLEGLILGQRSRIPSHTITSHQNWHLPTHLGNMAGESRYSIWRGDHSIDKWYYAATNSIGNQEGLYNINDMGEMLYFDIGKSREAQCPTAPINDWFYEATHQANKDVTDNGESSFPRAIPTKKI